MTTDESGGMASSAAQFQAFGAGGGASAGQPGFQGQQSAGGLVYMRNRWYDPNTGRFTQQDPIGFGGGINLYAYAGNDPVNYSDPFGLCPVEKTGIPCFVTMGLQGAATGTVAGALYGAAGGTLVVPGVGTVAGGAGGAVVGGGTGLLAGSAVGAARDLSSALQMSGLGNKVSETADKIRGWMKVVVIGGTLAPGETTTGTAGDRLPVPPGAEQPAKDDKRPPKQPPEP